MMSEPLARVKLWTNCLARKWWFYLGGLHICTIVKGLICRASEFTHLVKTSSSDSTFLEIEINLLECKNF